MVQNPFATRSVYVLGAGFSKPAGLPLGTELWKEVLKVARERGYYGPLEKQIRMYLDFKRSVHGCQLTETDINLEEFVSYLDNVSLFGLGPLEPSHPPIETPNVTRALQLVRYLIAWSLFERQASVEEEKPRVYREFASRLKANDIVITFNYDTLLERTLDDLNRKYQFDNEPMQVDHISVLKMHGSIDWFEEQPLTAQGRLDHNNKDIFPVSVGRCFGAQQLHTPGETRQGPLGRILRIRDLAAYFAKGVMSKDIPFVIPPSYQKLIYLSPLLGFWRAFTDTDFVRRVVIIGYSLPSFDQYAQIALYRLTRGNQCQLVDCRQSKQEKDELREHYRFLNWDKTDCHFDGFNMEAINMIFAE